ncbi:HEAT repeat domain-containing protein [Aquibacillus rhizosphaerae]|uniref:HEAT repeat domain-containing protein n=1 Tax=Aquibacillus rhizosphaerae TaxID=3051431 RepID=A0ABT7LAK1_9BACI|nr:hypothetical protein [Aquibacillus sp. LR5S19]MDL4842894.1 hypothetical protein [Aquibacillus sp. LR5S19]
MDFQSKVVLIFLNVSILFLLLLFLSYLLIVKDRRTKKENEMKQINLFMDPYVKAFVFNGEIIPRTLFKQRGIYFEVLEKQLYQLYSYVNKENEKDRIDNLVQAYLLEYYQEKLKHRRLSIRMNALYYIEDFNITYFEKELMKRYRQNNYEDLSEKYQVMRVLSSNQSYDYFNFSVLDKEEHPKFIYKDMLQRFDKSYSLQYINFFSLLPMNFKKAILEWIGEVKELSKISFIEATLHDKQDEIRISALKALYHLGVVSDVNLIVEFSSSELYQERVLFARLAMIMQKQRLKSLLIQMVTDSNWFVRQAVGEAIASYSDGNIILEYILESHQDRFARDLAVQWLEVGDQVWI